MNKLIQSKWFPHVAAIAIAALVIIIYFNPMLSGKVLKQHDVKQWQATYHEVDQFQQKTGERTFWTNSIFSGMPTFLIGPSYYYNFTNTLCITAAKVLPNPTDTLFFLFICFYILLIALDVNPWWAIAGSLAFMLSSFNFINIDAGHVGKGNAIAFMPLVLAGIYVTLHKNKLFGALLTGIALSLELNAGHLQITYYLMLIIIAWMIAEIIVAFKNKRIMHLLICGVFLLVSSGVGIATGATNLLATEEYGKYSIRGPSELTKTAAGESNQEITSTGLDKDYALQWSNGVWEPFTVLIPNFYGGSSNAELSTSSETYKVLKQNNIPNAKQVIQQLPVYWGDQPFTAGPIYYGAIICYLFILGLFIVKGMDKWWILGISAVAIMLSMGRNFMSFTDLFFYHFPLYNKFRSVTFILCITQTLFPLLGMLAIRDIFSGKLKPEEIKKGLLRSLYVTGGLCLLFAVLPGLFFDFNGLADRQLPDWIKPTLIADREGLMRMDALRSLVFIGLTFVLLWFYVAKKIKNEYVIAGVMLLIVVDLWGVDKRYLNEKDFEPKKKDLSASFPKSQADEIILQDPDPHYRVYNTTQRLDQDAITSYWHKSIGGYHGAKLRRYQELIDFHLGKGNPEAFDMLNVKYFIVGDSTGNVYPQRNPGANGNAWFVQGYGIVPNADAEIDSLNLLNTKLHAVIDKRFSDQLHNLVIHSDSTASIKLTSYAPNKLVYASNANSEQMAVFSEIYYEKGWNAYVDGTPVPHFRCDYVLRGMLVPAGKHTIEFKFEPEVVAKGEKITLVASILLYGGIVVIGGLGFIRNRKKEQA